MTPGGFEPPLSDRKSDVLDLARRWGRRSPHNLRIGACLSTGRKTPTDRRQYALGQAVGRSPEPSWKREREGVCTNENGPSNALLSPLTDALA